MDASYVSKLERGKNLVCLDSLFYLAERLGVKPSELVREVEEKLIQYTRFSATDEISATE